MVRLRQADFVNRSNFGHYLNVNGLTGLAVEVGVHRAEFSDELLQVWRGQRFYGIDPWSIPPGYEDQAACLPHKGRTREYDYEAAKARLKPYKNVVNLIRCDSADGSLLFLESSIDFVYIDGDHREEMVTKDLERWWPYVRPGGVLGGHDILDHLPDTNSECIQPAVFSFAEKHGLVVHLVVEQLAMPWSFFFRKPINSDV